MMTQSQFKKGDVLFRQGDASDRVLRFSSGADASGAEFANPPKSY
jgi:hypothetical protein